MTSHRPKAGDKAPEISVFDSEGNTFRLEGREGSDRNSLFILYRGHW